MNLSSDSRVLIAECCTHAPLKEDIGREKIPRMLKKKYGETLKVTVVSGTDYPKDLTPYDLIIQCGACMFNRKYVLHRIQQAKKPGRGNDQLWRSHRSIKRYLGQNCLLK